MKCKFCGYENSPDAKFCFNCGAQLNDESEVLTDKKSKGKKKIIIALVVVLILIVIIGALVYAFMPKIQRSVMGETQYYLYKETKNIEQVLNFDVIKELDAPNSFTASSKLSAESSVDDDSFSNYFNTFNGKVNLSYDKENSKASFNGIYNSNDDEIINISLAYDDNKIAVFDNDESIVFDFDWLKAISDKSSNGSKDSSNGNDLLKSVNDICDEQFNKNCISDTGKDYLNGQKYDCVKYEFSNADIVKIGVSVLKVAAKDKNVSSVLAKLIADQAIVEWLYEMDIISEEDISIETLFIELYDDINLLKDYTENYEYKVFYDWRGNIVARVLTVKNTENPFKLEVNTDIKKTDLKLNAIYYDFVNSDWHESAELSYLKNVVDGKTNCTFDYQEKDVEYPFNINATIKDFGIETIDGVKVFTGSFNFNSGEDLRIGLSADNSDTYDILFNLESIEDSDDYFAVKIKTDISSKANVSDVEMSQNTDYDEFFDDLTQRFSENYYNYFSQYVNQ